MKTALTSCRPLVASAFNEGTPISPVPRKTTRMSGERCLQGTGLNDDQPGGFVSLSRPLLNLTLTERFRATGAQIVIYLFSGKNEQKAFAHRHGAAALAAVERRGSKILELAHRILWNEIGFVFASARNMGNNCVQDHYRWLGRINIHDKIIAIVVK